ncbi:MAG TPA: hypothetical protein VKY66_05850 [Protaetiibacter sp.]|nr:hypothetical protein [Protaetiibacter sp.]
MPTELSRVLRFSARDVDPMSWFTGPFVPLVIAAFIAVYGGVMTVIGWGTSPLAAVQAVGVALCALGCLLVQLLTSLRNRVEWQLGAAVVVVSGSGMVVSALGYADTVFSFEQWWAPFCFGLALSSLAPYLSTWRLLAWGAVALVTVAPLAHALVQGHVPDGESPTAFLILVTPIAVAIAAVTAFSYSVVTQMLPIVDNRSSAIVSEALQVDPADEEAERVMLARYTARAVPFLRVIAERGTVSEGDRALAGEIARYLRDDLVSRSDLAWLGLRADDTRVVIVDPERRAQSMRAAQRAAIRDLVRALLDDPGTDATTVFMELRSHEDGSTAVAITLDTELPEGRRVRHLAPYYFNLRGEMRDVRIQRDGLSFRVPPDSPDGG